MADTVLRAAILRKHLPSLVRDLLTFIPNKSVCSLHGQNKWSAFPLAMGNNRLHRTRCSWVLESCAGLYARHMTSYLRPCWFSQAATSYVINGGLRSRNNSAGLGGINIAPSCYMQVRQKSKNRQQDNSDEEDSEAEDALEDDDFEAPPNFKIVKIHVASTRADAVVSHALDVGRNILEDIFLGSGLYLNGSKLLKKSEKMDTGDYVDLVVEKSIDQLKVKRVKVLKIYPEKTSKEKFLLKVRVWKAPFEIEKPENEPNNS